MSDDLARAMEKARIRGRWIESLKDGEPCDHPGCLSHVSHPCEGCGRIGGIRTPTEEPSND